MIFSDYFIVIFLINNKYDFSHSQLKKLFNSIYFIKLKNIFIIFIRIHIKIYC